MSTLIQRVFLAILLGILLMVLGNGLENSWLALIGALIFAASAFWGAFFLQAEHVAMRIAMLVIAGLAAISLISSSGVSSYIPGL
jgi:hypothetical protein